MKFLLAKLGHLGDTLLLTPTLRGLRRRHPDARIDVVVRAGCEAVLEGNPDATRVIPVPGPGALGAVFARRYDYAFDLSNSDRSKLLILASGAKTRVINDWGTALGWRRAIFNRFTHFAWGREHQVLRDWRAVADVLGWPEEPGPLVFAARAPAAAPAAPCAVIHPVSRWAFKEWLPERWAEVADRLATDFQVVFSCGPAGDERERVAAILRLAKGPHRSTEGRLGLRELGGLLGGARLFLGVDTLAMHLAAAMGTPSVALFGPSSEWSWRPWRVKHELVLGECPCKASRRFVCDKSSAYPCMRRIEVDQVLAAAGRVLPSAAT